MLESTFQHIPGVGEASERSLWRRGYTNWNHIIKSDFNLPPNRYRRLKAAVLESIGRLDDLDHHYFRERLNAGLTWRAYNAFKEDACFLDIETTGLSPANSEVTTVCVHSRDYTRNYIAGENLQELRNDLEDFRFIVTFNGARFDLPFLTNALDIRFHQIHLDLMYPLRKLGIRGGLKVIEKKLGISRGTDGVTGYDAVRLWRAHKRNMDVEVAGRKVKAEDALELLVRYNQEDTVNLQELTELTVGKMRDACMKPIL